MASESCLTRSLDRGNQALKLINEELGDDTSSAGECRVMELDLGSFDSIRKFAEKVNLELPSLEIAVFNAGIMALPERTETSDGFESQIGVNHFGHAYLFSLIADKLSASEEGKLARLVVLSSSAHQMAPKGGINFDDLQSTKEYAPWKAYGQSKLANLLWAKGVDKNFPKIRAVSVHPGVVSTELARNMNGLGQKFFSWFGKSVEDGATTQIKCAVSAEYNDSTFGGKYFADREVCTPTADAQDEQLAERLWNVTREIVDEKVLSMN